MPLYEYKAYDAGGRATAGLIDAPSRASAFGKLKKQGVYPISLSEETGKTFKAKVPTADMIFSLDQLTTLLKAGIPLPEALDSLVGQLDNDELKRAYARVKVHLEEGETFASSLSMEQIFPPVLVKMVEAGESVGSVDLILERFTIFMENETAFRERVISALLYPVIIMTASIGLIFFLLVYVAPTLVQVFKSFHSEMPLPTRILIGLGSILKNNIYLIIVLLVAIIFVYFKILPRTYRDSLRMRLPIFGFIHVQVQVSRWARTLAMLHAGGVTLIKALASAREVVDNVIIKEDLKKIEDYVQKGERLGPALGRITTMPHLIAQLTDTGEKSGELERMLNTAAGFYEKEVDRKLSLFFKFLEPAIIIFLGITVGFVVVSALLPIFEINKLIR